MLRSKNRRILRAVCLLLIANQLVVFGPALHANPQGGTVVAGQAAIEHAAAVTTITQGTDKAIINWQGFSNAAHETVRFAQPAVTSVTLNRVVGVDPSSIQGAMEANGRIFLINPNGILFGPGSRVNVGGLIASTLSITDQDFLSGNYRLVRDPSRALAAVVNKGRITASPGGYVALVAPIVNNEGEIVAAAGRVVLAGASEATLSVDDQGLVNVKVPVDKARDVVQGQGDASELLQTAVNNSHIVEAGRVVVRDGRVVMEGAEGLAVNEGKIDVSATPAAPAGRVHIEGTQSAVLGPRSLIIARNDHTGDGGAVKVKAPRNVTVGGLVDTTAADGLMGTVLIDPADLIIADGAGRPGTISEDWIEAQLSSVVLEADDTITMETLGELELHAGSSLTLRTLGLDGPGDITMDLDDSIRTSGNGRITVEAAVLGTHAADVLLGSLSTSNRDITVRNLGTGGSLWVSKADASPNGDITLVNAHGNIATGLLEGDDLELHAGGSIHAATAVDRIDATAGSAETGTGDIFLDQTGDVRLGTITAGGDVEILVEARKTGPTYQSLDVFAGDLSGGIISGRNVTLIVGQNGGSDHEIKDGQGTALTNIAAQETATLSVYGSGGRLTSLEVVSGVAPTFSAADNSSSWTVDVELGALSAVAGTISLYSPRGDVTNGHPGVEVTSPSLAVVSHGSIGSVDHPIEVHLTDSLWATSASGSIGIVNVGLEDVELSRLWASHEISVRSLGSLNLGSITAMDRITLSAFLGSLVDANGAAVNLVAPVARVEALGNIGTALDPIETHVDRLETVGLTPLSVHIVEDDGLELPAVRAQGLLSITTLAGDILLGEARSNFGDITLAAPGGSILDDNGLDRNLSAVTAHLTAGGSIGAAGDPLETRLEGLHATALAGGVHLSEEGGIFLVSVFAGTDVDVATGDGDMLLGAVVAGDTITLRVGTGSILDANGGSLNLVAASAVLGAAGRIGTELDPLDTQVEHLIADALLSPDGVSIVDQDGLYVERATADQDIRISAMTGDIRLGEVRSSSGELRLAALGGSLLDANGDELNLSGHSALLAAGGSIGTAEDPLETQLGMNTLAAVAIAGDIQLVEMDGMHVALALAGGDVRIATLEGSLAVGTIVAGGTIHLEALGCGGDILATRRYPWVQGERGEFHASGTIDLAGALAHVESTAGNAVDGTGAVRLSLDGDVTVHTVTAGGDVLISTSGIMTLGEPGRDIVSGDHVDLIASEIVDGQADSAGVALTNVSVKTSLSVSVGSGTVADPIELADGGNVHLGEVSVTAGTISIHAPGFILDGNGEAPNLVAPGAALVAGGGVGTDEDWLETDLGTSSLYATTGGSVFVEEANDIRLARVTAGEDVNVRSREGDILVTWVEAGGTAFLDAAGSIRGAEPASPCEEPPESAYQLKALRGDLHAGDDIELRTHVMQLDATAGTAADFHGGIDITNFGSLQVLGTITAGADVRLSLLREPWDFFGLMPLLVVLGTPVGGLISGRNVTLDVGELRSFGTSAVIDRQFFDGWLPDGTPPTANISAEGRVAVQLHGHGLRAFGIPFFSPIEIAADGESSVSVDADLTGWTYVRDAWIRSLEATAGTLSVYVPHGDLLDANGPALNLDAPSAALRVRADIGKPDDPLETQLGNESLWALSRRGGVWLVEEDGLHIEHVRAEGDVDIRTLAGDILLGRVNTAGRIYLDAAGSILDANGDAVNLILRGPLATDSLLVAGHVIGTAADAIEVLLESGTLTVGPRGQILCVSANLSGEIAPVDGLGVLGEPPGNVYWNGAMVWQGCRDVGPEGEEEEPIGPQGEEGAPLSPATPVVPGLPAATPEVLVLPGIPGYADPSQALQNLGPTIDVTTSTPEEEIEQRKRLIEVRGPPDA